MLTGLILIGIVLYICQLTLMFLVIIEEKARIRFMRMTSLIPFVFYVYILIHGIKDAKKQLEEE